MIGRAVFLCLAVSAIGALALPAPAAANLAQEVQAGRALAAAVESGRSSCGELSNSQFDAIGEFTMARYVGDERAHEAMNRRMVRMMGETGEARMHAALGRRYSGCADEAGWIGPMAGMMTGARGGFGPGMMASGRHFGPGSSAMSTAAWIAILIVVAAAAVTLTLLLSRRQSPAGAATREGQ
jgi:hypothetical protein